MIRDSMATYSTPTVCEPIKNHAFDSSHEKLMFESLVIWDFNSFISKLKVIATKFS